MHYQQCSQEAHKSSVVVRTSPKSLFMRRCTGASGAAPFASRKSIISKLPTAHAVCRGCLHDGVGQDGTLGWDEMEWNGMECGEVGWMRSGGIGSALTGPDRTGSDQFGIGRIGSD